MTRSIAEIPDLPYSDPMSTESAFSSEEIIDDAFIGRRVHQLMWDQKMTQTKLGALVGIDQSTVAKRLRGNIQWQATLVARTARALNTTAAYLLGETDDPSMPGGPASQGGRGSAERLQ